MVIVEHHYVTILLAKMLIWALFSQSMCTSYFCINPWWKTTVIHTNIAFTHNFSHVQISCLKKICQRSDCLLNKSFTITLRKDKVNVSQTKIIRVFSCNTNASTEP